MGKIISIAILICFCLFVFCFQITISLLAYLVTLSGELYFRKSCFFRLHQSNYIDTTVTFLEQLFLHSNCLFFEKLCFWKSHFLAAVIFSEYLIFRSEVSTKQLILENRKFFRTVLFGTPTILVEELCRINISKEELLFRSGCFCAASAFSEERDFRRNYFFQKRNIPHKLFFLESHLLRAVTFPKDVTFYNRYLFKKATFSQHILFRRVIISQLRFVSTATLTIYQLVIKWAQYQLRLLKLWEFFLLDPLLLKIVS